MKPTIRKLLFSWIIILMMKMRKMIMVTCQQQLVYQDGYLYKSLKLIYFGNLMRTSVSKSPKAALMLPARSLCAICMDSTQTHFL